MSLWRLKSSNADPTAVRFRPLPGSYSFVLLEHHVSQESFAGLHEFLGARVVGEARAEVELDGRIEHRLHFFCSNQLSDSLLVDCVYDWQLKSSLQISAMICNQ